MSAVAMSGVAMGFVGMVVVAVIVHGKLGTQGWDVIILHTIQRQ